MADRYVAGHGSASDRDTRLVNPMSKLANLAGAAISLGLIAGVGYWGYQLIKRDVSGVPVVRAAQGPMRVAPVDPGGSPAQHQGLAVNTVAAEGSAEQPADRLILAPRPVDLTEDDTPATKLADTAPQATGTAQTGAEAGDSEPEDAVPQLASIQTLADQLASGVTPLEGSGEAQDSDPEVVAALAAASNSVKKPTITGGLARSLRPQMRPGGLADSATLVKASAPESEEIDATSLPAGTRLVQLGAYESADIARTEWTKLNQRFTEYLEGKDRVIERAESGGRTFYRLRAMGFEDLSDARRFCSALVAEKADCIPVVTR